MRKIDLLYVITVIILVLLLIGSCDKQKSAQDLYNATQDTLRVTVNKLGQQTASISVLKAADTKQFLKLKTQDSTILHLQDVVKDYKGRLATATVLSNTTSDVGTTATVVSFPDTSGNETKDILYPIYETQWNERWSVGSIRASRDSISRDIKVKNEYEITQGEEKRGLFKPRILTVNVKNLNPNTETVELRVFTVDVPNKRFSFGVQAGYGVLLNGTGTGPYIGVGGSWTILKF